MTSIRPKRAFPASKTLLSLAGAASLAALAACTTVPPEGVTPVAGFDVNRYMGQWYEIARLHHRFERGLTNVTATYALRPDGGVQVVNRGFDTASCSFNEREGRATFNGDTDVASLAVSFFGPFAGGYFVTELAPDYSYAVVSGPNKDFYWILSRTPQISDRLLNRLIAEAEAAGYPVEELILVDQSGPTC
jgi:apolipoprotein D and lipocalin family protein